MKGLVLSGGKGTRLRPLTFTGAKQLVPVANKPVLFYALEALGEAGVEEIAIVVPADLQMAREQIMAAVGDGSRFGARVTYVEQDAPRGIAHGVSICREFVGDDKFVVFLDHHFFQAAQTLKPSARGELEITEALAWLVAQGYDVRPQMVEGYWIDAGKHIDMLDANRLVLDTLEPRIDGEVDRESQVV